MFKVETKRIGVHAYKVTQLDAITGRRVFMRLAKVIGPAMAKLDGKSEEAWAAALGELLSTMSEADLDYFCDTFAAVTEVSGGQYKNAAPQLDTVFMTHFAGEYLNMVTWLIFCMQVNFSSFFRGAGQAIAGLASLAPSDSTSPKA